MINVNFLRINSIIIPNKYKKMNVGQERKEKMNVDYVYNKS